MEDLENIEEYSSEEEEEIMENNPLDKLIPNHKELSREEIGREIFKFVNKNFLSIKLILSVFLT